MSPIWKVLQDAKADIILSGHDHHYERFAPQDAEGNLDTKNGIRQFIVGTGGAKQAPLFRHKPNSEIRASQTFGVLQIKLNQNSYNWKFLAISGSSFSDMGSAQCHSKSDKKTDIK